MKAGATINICLHNQQNLWFKRANQAIKTCSVFNNCHYRTVRFIVKFFGLGVWHFDSGGGVGENSQA